MGTIKQRHFIKAEPEEVYQSLTNPFAIELWTGYPAEMNTEPGSEFSIWNGDITGRNISFEENAKIVQQWYFEGSGEHSLVTITLHKAKRGTTVYLVHENVPEEAMENMETGWKDYYFEALRDFFEK